MKITPVRRVRSQKIWRLASFSKSKGMPTNCPLRIRSLPISVLLIFTFLSLYHPYLHLCFLFPLLDLSLMLSHEGLLGLCLHMDPVSSHAPPLVVSFPFFSSLFPLWRKYLWLYSSAYQEKGSLWLLCSFFQTLMDRSYVPDQLQWFIFNRRMQLL